MHVLQSLDRGKCILVVFFQSVRIFLGGSLQLKQFAL